MCTHAPTHTIDVKHMHKERKNSQR
jgi:hypothetical protein